MREGDWAVTPLGDSSGKGLVEDGVEKGRGGWAECRPSMCNLHLTSQEGVLGHGQC